MIKKNKTYIIAEIGGNHNGGMALAKKLIKKSKESGADAVKFQTFEPKELTIDSNLIAKYQKKNIKKKLSTMQILELCKLEEKQHYPLIKYAKKMKIDFLSSAFDFKSVVFLNKLNLKYQKIPSGEITNFRTLYHHGKHKNKVILSTGMSNLKEIQKALNVLLLGYKNKSVKHKFVKSFSKKDKIILKKYVYLLHCVSNYPTKIENLNLRCIKLLKDKFNLKVGFSDHTLSLTAASYAVSLGAEIIEKHITLDKNMVGPDHKSSILPKEFKIMVNNIRECEKSLGNPKKIVNEEEKDVRIVARQHLIASQEIKKNEIFSLANLTTKRGRGKVSANKFFEYLDTRSKYSYKKDNFIR